MPDKAGVATKIAAASAVASALSAICAAFTAYLNYGHYGQQDYLAKLQTMTSLSAQSNILLSKFSQSIDDVPSLTSYLYLLSNYEDAGRLPKGFFDLQFQTWCPITKRAPEKLQAFWEDASFQKLHESGTRFRTLLSDLDGRTGKKCQ